MTALNLLFQQESIQVGCVKPPFLVSSGVGGGGSAKPLFPKADPLEVDPNPTMQTPLWGRPPGY